MLSCRAGVLGLGHQTFSPQTRVGSCIPSANRLATEVRGRCPAGASYAPLGFVGHATPVFWGAGVRACGPWLAEGRRMLWELWGRGGQVPFDL